VSLATGDEPRQAEVAEPPRGYPSLGKKIFGLGPKSHSRWHPIPLSIKWSNGGHHETDREIDGACRDSGFTFKAHPHMLCGCRGQNGFQVDCGVNFKYPTLAPNRNPTPERIGTRTMSFAVNAVIPKPPIK
jgi:hypothetical protein